ncbi:hypothetical protein H310_08377 [Aphanomyces invadans]|uniref:Uncharacterized protein n=1 Tax=Aphanomyces invadans TaxID=157072 RepID=A0A024TY04_9STRA|nr:hypothetical protein H310_08377 [Aphanomyces invadans]ETV98883.1 hypothetical protein H310_08377 [Aphanomyces invadans]|eukprot:XP_008872311.1 hypothetical protein H310_08377 [Aphanomyces invadans]
MHVTCFPSPHVLAQVGDDRQTCGQTKATAQVVATPAHESPHFIFDLDVTADAAVERSTIVMDGNGLNVVDASPSLKCADHNGQEDDSAPPPTMTSVITLQQPRLIHAPSSRDFVPLETLLDNASRTMYSIVRSHIVRCNNHRHDNNEDINIVLRALDRANERIHGLELDNARLVDALVDAERRVKTAADENALLKESVEASRLERLLHQATLQHVDILRHDLLAQKQVPQNVVLPEMVWPPEINAKLDHVDKLLYTLHAIQNKSGDFLTESSNSLPCDEISPLEHGMPSPQWQAMESRVHELVHEMHMATQHMADMRASVVESVHRQLDEVEALLRHEVKSANLVHGALSPSNLPLDTMASTDPPEFRKCTVPACPKGVRSRGLCNGHGGGKRCEVAGCVKSNQGGGGLHCPRRRQAVQRRRVAKARRKLKAAANPTGASTPPRARPNVDAATM